VADRDSTIQAVIALEEAHGKAMCLADAISEAVGDSPPSWLLVFQGELRAIGEAMDLVSRLVRHRDGQ
jgi:hypothetical protein